jgi:CRP-like cAMP-binding protein
METKPSVCEFCKEKSCAVATLSNDEQAWMSGTVQRVKFERGETLFREGVLNSHIFYMKKGLVKLHMKVTEDRDFILKIATPPSFLGLPTIFGDRVNQFSATALETTEVCMIDISTFKHLILNNGNFAYEIIADICREELHTFRRHIELQHKQTPGRLAGVLLFFANDVYFSPSFELPLDRSELAELLGLSREIVTRTLMQFREDGMIEIDKKRITILQADQLKAIEQAG